LPQSDFIAFIDESGDHGLVSIDPANPIFVLAVCIFNKEQYVTHVGPALQKLKFRFFGHDQVILHGHEIRKAKGEFTFLINRKAREAFLEQINTFVAEAPFTTIAAVIDKTRLKQRYAQPFNPYTIALRFCLERTFAFVRDAGQGDRLTHVIVESRGRKEDNELELEFRRICEGANQWGPLPFRIRFASKHANAAGLQLADLVAHPISRHAANPLQANRAFDIIEGKLRRSPDGNPKGWGLKIFP
jgi:hypothetical protein